LHLLKVINVINCFFDARALFALAPVD